MASGQRLLDLQTLPHGTLLQVLSDKGVRPMGMLASPGGTPHRIVHQLLGQLLCPTGTGVLGGSRYPIVVGSSWLRPVRLARGFLPTLTASCRGCRSSRPGYWRTLIASTSRMVPSHGPSRSQAP